MKKSDWLLISNDDIELRNSGIIEALVSEAEESSFVAISPLLMKPGLDTSKKVSY